jgi:hypothetical protein
LAGSGMAFAWEALPRAFFDNGSVEEEILRSYFDASHGGAFWKKTYNERVQT